MVVGEVCKEQAVPTQVSSLDALETHIEKLENRFYNVLKKLREVKYKVRDVSLIGTDIAQCEATQPRDRIHALTMRVEILSDDLNEKFIPELEILEDIL